MEISRLSSGIGVHIELLDNLALLDLALDIIGFPEEGKDGFSREYLKNGEWDLGYEEVNNYVESLFRLFDELLLDKPYLFLKKE